jgi:hypothetical protein
MVLRVLLGRVVLLVEWMGQGGAEGGREGRRGGGSLRGEGGALLEFILDSSDLFEAASPDCLRGNRRDKDGRKEGGREGGREDGGREGIRTNAV